MEITNGTLKTDGSGTFNVTFDAVPDLSVNKTYMPAFVYTVYADVTDLNGETHSSDKTIRLGYTGLVLSAQIPDQLDKTAKKAEFSINSTNLDGDFLASQGTMTVYKLKDSTRAQRTRMWLQADIKLINEEDYHKQFPYDVFANENDYHTWERTKTVFSEKFDTAKKKTVDFSSVSGWETGKYCFEMNAKDIFGK
ncbi:MAG: hypothetical protein MZV63_15220 [Marinilabiliales bacterium]|nr:hypothetical protein [Marinilabiliales bacterium]